MGPLDQGDEWDPEEDRFLLWKRESLHEYPGLPSPSGISWTEINAHGRSSSAGLAAAVPHS